MHSFAKVAATVALLFAGSMTGAQALPHDSALADGGPALVQPVVYGDGCGRFAVRTGRGFCRTLGYGPRFNYGPRPYWGPRYSYGPRFYGPRFYGPRYYRRW